jgi:hypothetical protein
MLRVTIVAGDQKPCAQGLRRFFESGSKAEAVSSRPACVGNILLFNFPADAPRESIIERGATVRLSFRKGK